MKRLKPYIIVVAVLIALGFIYWSGHEVFEKSYASGLAKTVFVIFFFVLLVIAILSAVDTYNESRENNIVIQLQRREEPARSLMSYCEKRHMSQSAYQSIAEIAISKGIYAMEKEEQGGGRPAP